VRSQELSKNLFGPDVLKNMSVDYMHDVLEGIGKDVMGFLLKRYSSANFNNEMLNRRVHSLLLLL